MAVLTAIVLTGCVSETLPPAPPARAALADGVTRAESLAILQQIGDRGASAAASATAVMCTIDAWNPGAVMGCGEPVPTVVPEVPWLQHSGQAVDPGEIEQREPIQIAFAHPVRAVSLWSTGALKCTGFLGRMVGFRDGVEVGRADNTLIEPSDCGEDDVTYGVEGQLLPSVGIDSLVIEGVDPWLFEVLGYCCGRARLQYTVHYEPGDNIVVTCTPAPVPRGAQVTCTASPPPGATTVTVAEWRFVGPEIPSPIVEASMSLQWVGAAATAGVVSASGTIDGVSATGAGSLTVSARDWTQDTVMYTLAEIPSGLNPRPTNQEDFGRTTRQVRIFLILGPAGRVVIPDGPNAGVRYLTRVPVSATAEIEINRIALSVGSDFYFLQPRNAPREKCTRDDVAPLLPLVEEHEGLTLRVDPPSHAGTFRSELNRLVPQVTENVVALTDEDLLIKSDAAARPGMDAALLAARDVVEGGTVPAIQWCVFKYFQ